MLGQFGAETVSLRLEKLPTHAYVRIQFEFYTFASWDGLAHDASDTWMARVANGPRLVYASFSNTGWQQSYPFPVGCGQVPARSGGRQLNVAMPWFDKSWNEHTVYPMSFVVPHRANVLELHFAGLRLQKVEDESWTLDNVRVELLQDRDTTPLSVDELTQLWNQLGTNDPGQGGEAMRRLGDCGDRGVAYLAGTLGWRDDAAAREELEYLTGALRYDDWDMWSEAADQCRRHMPRARALVAACVDARRFGPAPPPWLDEVFGPQHQQHVTNPGEIRAGRAAWIIQLLWTPDARRTLFLP